MSLTSRRNGTGRLYVRRFDHEEAARRYAAGESVTDLALEYEVTTSALYKVLSPEQKLKEIARTRRWRTGTCDSCGGPAMRLVSAKAAHNPDGRCLCRRCRADVRRERLRFNENGMLVAVRCTSLDCANGERWQAPVNFARGLRHREVREGGIHTNCRACGTRAKRRYREQHPDYRRRNGGTRERRRNGEAVSATARAEASVG